MTRRDQVIKLWKEGKNPRSISHSLGVAQSSVTSILHYAGLRIVPSRTTRDRSKSTGDQIDFGAERALHQNAVTASAMLRDRCLALKARQGDASAEAMLQHYRSLGRAA